VIPVAHMGHWLMAVGFAGPPLTVIGGVLAMAIRERRRDPQSSEARSGNRGNPSSGIGSHTAA
jgi:hypothetical protein